MHAAADDDHGDVDFYRGPAAAVHVFGDSFKASGRPTVGSAGPAAYARPPSAAAIVDVDDAADARRFERTVLSERAVHVGAAAIRLRLRAAAETATTVAAATAAAAVSWAAGPDDGDASQSGAARGIRRPYGRARRR